MKVPKLHGKHVLGSRKTIIDKKLDQCISSGLISHFSTSVYSSEHGCEINIRYTPEYWQTFAKLLDPHEMIFILSYEQEGNWSPWLYSACEQEWEKICNTLEEELELEEQIDINK